jgi:hypothetical protein
VYYDLVASLPHLPYFERAERSPITRLRLEQRLRRLEPDHAEQLNRARALISWRMDRSRWATDEAQVRAYAALLASHLHPALKEYVEFRLDQRTLVAALRWKRDGLASPRERGTWGVGRWVRHVERHWGDPDFRLAHVYPWLVELRDLLARGDARGADRLSMAVAWRWLASCADRSTFGFEAVFSYVFRWDILEAWLACDPEKGRARFTDLIDKVTHVEQS